MIIHTGYHTSTSEEYTYPHPPLEFGAVIFQRKLNIAGLKKKLWGKSKF